MTTNMDLGSADVHQPGALSPAAKKKRRMRALKISFASPGGRFSVSHNMSDVERAPGVELAVECRESGDRPVWIQLAKVGTFKGHAAGEFSLTPKVFGEIVANFKATANQRIPIDFEHASEAEATDGSVPETGAPAQGWIVDLDNRGDGGLWGLVEWLPRAREYVKSGQYKFFSPAIRFNSRDRVTGKPIGARMTSGALTNNPFLDGMAPLTARDMADDEEAAFKDWLCGALGAHKLSAPDEIKARLARLSAMCKAGDDVSEFVAPMRVRLGMESSSFLEVLEVVGEMIEGAIEEHLEQEHGLTAKDEAANSGAEKENTMSDPNVALSAAKAEAELTIKAKDAEIHTLQAEVAKLKADADKRDAADRDREVDEAIAAHGTAKGIKASDKADLVVLLAANPEAFRHLYPRVAPEHRNLTSRITTADRSTATETGASPKGKPDVLLTARDLQKKTPGLSLDAAINKAQRMIADHNKKGG